jgi:hypothetical protein
MESITQDELSQFTKLSNADFHKALERAFQLSRKQELLVVHLMREADRRKIWAEMGYQSLMDYCVRSFKISETDFYRKRSILDTIREIPEIEAKILEGKLNTTSVSQAATFLKREAKLLNRPITTSEKRDVLFQLEGKSFREVQRELSPHGDSSTAQNPYAAPTRIQRTYYSTPNLEMLIERAKKAFAPLLPPGADHADLLTKVFEIALHAAGTPLEPKTQDREPISETIRLAVSRRDNFACAYVNPRTGLRCGSKHQLELNHITPYSRGGDDSIENLRLVCRTHNQHRTTKKPLWN